MGSYRDNGKKEGNYRDYWGPIGILERNWRVWGLLGLYTDDEKENGDYWDYWGYIKIMEKKTETIGIIVIPQCISTTA